MLNVGDSAQQRLDAMPPSAPRPPPSPPIPNHHGDHGPASTTPRLRTGRRKRSMKGMVGGAARCSSAATVAVVATVVSATSLCRHAAGAAATMTPSGEVAAAPALVVMTESVTNCRCAAVGARGRNNAAVLRPATGLVSLCSEMNARSQEL